MDSADTSVEHCADHRDTPVVRMSARGIERTPRRKAPRRLSFERGDKRAGFLATQLLENILRLLAAIAGQMIADRA